MSRRPAPVADPVPPVKINPSAEQLLDTVIERIETQRENLGVVISTLACLGLALEHGKGDLQLGICYHDVATLALRLVVDSMEALEIHVITDGVRS